MGRHVKRRTRTPLSLRHWVLVAAVLLALGSLVAYVVTRDTAVLSWATGLVGAAFGTAIGSGMRS
jgi:hypothetical protein